MYGIVLYIHIGAIILYSMLLLLRLYYLWTGQEEMLLLFSDRSRSANIFMLTLVVVTGLYLGFTYDFSEGLWFVIKLLLLGTAAFVGDYAFRNFNKLAGWGVLLIYAYIIAISITKSLNLVYAY